jgi:hypothetical protein
MPRPGYGRVQIPRMVRVNSIDARREVSQVSKEQKTSQGVVESIESQCSTRGFRVIATLAGVLSCASTVLLCALFLTGAADSRNARFDTIEVQRINVREPDGTLRLVLSNRQQLPGLFIKGREYPHTRQQAGLLFFSDEGSELGGLLFDGKKGSEKDASTAASLTFDRFEQDQQVQLAGFDSEGKAYAGLIVKDVPGRSILSYIEEQPRLAAMSPGDRAALMEERRRSNYYGARRLYVGKDVEQVSVVQLADASGKPRLLLEVTPQGKASIRFLDEAGHVVGELTPETMSAGRSGSQ